MSGSLEYTDSYGEVAQVAEKRHVAEAPRGRQAFRGRFSGGETIVMWGWVKTLAPSEHQNSW